jgi:hypothetical protein
MLSIWRGVFFLIKEITVPYGKNDFVIIQDVTSEDVDYIIEALEASFFILQKTVKTRKTNV